jgi:hypothetical protein
VQERVFKIADFPQWVCCTECLGHAWKIISRPAAVRPLMEEYWDENLNSEGVLVKGRRHRKEMMRREGLEERPLDSSVRRIKIEEREHNKRERAKEGGI